jgi:glucoamylase
LRDPHDPLVVATLEVVDRQLKAETPNGPAWRRYTGDGYGEQPDGSPFDGVGQGRPWPLLTGERGQYELVAGRDPLLYLKSMAAMTGRAGLIPEQVWDADPIPERGLHPGKPTGSAMPLVWAHAEFIKLAMSCTLGRPCDRPEAVWQRYRGRRPTVNYVIWTPRFPADALRPGERLCICLPAPALVHFGVDGWQQIADLPTRDTGLGMYVAELRTVQLREGQRIDMTFYWTGSEAWEGRDYRIDIHTK